MDKTLDYSNGNREKMETIGAETVSLKVMTTRRIIACTLLVAAMLSCRTSHRKMVDRQNFAVERLRALPQLVNAADCTPLLQYVDPTESRQVWTGACEQIRQRFGKWTQLLSVSMLKAPGSRDYLIVQGRALFTAGEVHVEAHWNTASDPPRLFYLDLSAGDGERFSIPATKPEFPRDLPPSAGSL